MNLFLITIDCLRANDLYYMSKFMKEVMGKAVVLNNHFTNGVPTPYAFRALMTSLPPLYRLRFSNLPKWYETRMGAYLLGGKAVAERFRELSYETIAVVDNPWVSKYFNYHRGFKYFIDLSGRTLFGNILLRGRREVVKGSRKLLINSLRESIKRISNSRAIRLVNLLRDSIFKGSVNALANDFLFAFNRGEYLFKVLIDILRRKGVKDNVFAWVHLMDLHDVKGTYLPLYYKSSKLKLLYVNLIRNLVAKDVLKSEIKGVIRRLYLSCLEYVDKVLTDLITNKLPTLGFDVNRNTYVVITADHGDEHLEHGGLYHEFPFKLYNELVKVPLLIVGPNASYKMIRKLSCHAVLGKSLHHLSNGNVDDMLDSINCSYVISETYGCRGEIEDVKYAVISSKWKLIVHIINRKVRKVELYDISKDPNELINVASKEKEVTKELINIVIRHCIREGQIALGKIIKEYLLLHK